MNTQSTAKHTQGQWRVGDAGHSVFGPPNGQPAPETIAYGIRNKANAALIAQAPSLLAQNQALREALTALMVVVRNEDLTITRAGQEPHLNAYLNKAQTALSL